MCTAAAMYAGGLYFGRTLDLEVSYEEEVVVIPRRFRLGSAGDDHLAVIGMAHVENGYPLLYDGMNEAGLAAAALNFPGYACFGDDTDNKMNIPHYDFLAWILGSCASMSEAVDKLKNTNITGRSYNGKLPAAQLHWMIADASGAIVVEQTSAGLEVYKNEIGVMTNSPSFPEQMLHLSDYMGLSPYGQENRFAPDTEIRVYSRGMGAIGLPGDLSSRSRFVRAAFALKNSSATEDAYSDISRFFHVMDTVGQVAGLNRLENGERVITVYTSCCDTENGVYYYTTYGNRSISALDMHRHDTDGDSLVRYMPDRNEKIYRH